MENYQNTFQIKILGYEDGFRGMNRLNKRI